VDLRSLPEGVLAFLVLALALFGLVQSLRIAIRRQRVRRRLLLIRERGVRGEARGEELLRRKGYVVLGSQVSATYELEVDGEKLLVPLRADYVVSGKHRRYVAEVKTGSLAPRIETRATRRQLLEYGVAFRPLGVGGILLVDPEAGLIRTVEFPRGEPFAPPARSGAWLVLALAAGLSLAMLVRYLGSATPW
jgi:hypothetical protein